MENLREIPPGAALNPEQHLYDEIIYIFAGAWGDRGWEEGVV
ncbi:MAG: hypothetical protein ACE5JU_05620 [Candidatus Binatia bacterium]